MACNHGKLIETVPQILVPAYKVWLM